MGPVAHVTPESHDSLVMGAEPVHAELVYPLQSRQLTVRVLMPWPHVALHAEKVPLTYEDAQVPELPELAAAGAADDPDTQPPQPTHANWVLGTRIAQGETNGEKKLFRVLLNVMG